MTAGGGNVGCAESGVVAAPMGGRPKCPCGGVKWLLGEVTPLAEVDPCLDELFPLCCCCGYLLRLLGRPDRERCPSSGSRADRPGRPSNPLAGDAEAAGCP